MFLSSYCFLMHESLFQYRALGLYQRALSSFLAFPFILLASYILLYRTFVRIASKFAISFITGVEWVKIITLKGETMALRQRTRSLTAAGGLDDALQNLAPQPVPAKRDPTTSDTAPIGTEWCNTLTKSVFFLASISNGQANWVNVAGGSGTFTNLTVTGTTLLEGATTINSGTGDINISTDSTATTVEIATGNGVKQLFLGSTHTGSSVEIDGAPGGSLVVNGAGGTFSIHNINAALDVYTGTGALTISNDAAATTVSLGTGAAAKTVTVGSLTTTSSLTLRSGTGGIGLATGATTPGLVGITPGTATAASPTASVTVNSRVIAATFTGFTTAAAGTQAFTITSSAILSTSAIFVTVTNASAGNSAKMTLTGVTQAVGSIVVNTTNNGAQALDSTVYVNVWILN